MAYTVSMPAAYTHFSIAKAVLQRLPKDLQNAVSSPEMYFFGAQGADFCFFYRAFRPSEINFGRFLHNRGSYGFFHTLLPCAGRDKGLFSYALGYITHYAADCVFHPYVYHLSGKSPVKHSRAEGALDFYFRRKDAEKEDLKRFGKYFNCTVSEKEVSSLYTLYALAAARADRDPLIKSSFVKGIRNYRAYTRFSARMFAKENEGLLNAEHKEWSYPDDMTKIMTDGAEEMSVSGDYKYSGEEGEIYDQLLVALKERLEKDYDLGYTTVGPHRDDLKIKVNGIDVRTYGSQGQQRTCALSLKLAEAEIFKDRFGEYPVLILDDAMSELDKNRRKNLMSAAKKMQKIITCTEPDCIPDFELYNNIKINNGKIIR